MVRGLAEQHYEDERLQKAVQQIDAQIGWDDFGNRMSTATERAGNWAGCPRPSSQPLVLEPRWPYQALQGTYETEDGKLVSQEDRQVAADICRVLADDADDKITIINSWYSKRHEATVLIFDVNGRRKLGFEGVPPVYDRWDMAMNTMGSYRAWQVSAEMRAIETLKDLILPAQYASYLLTGGFLESSPRSKLFYWFRKLKPTLVMHTVRTDSGDMVMPLVALCLHPIGYYSGSFAGCMCPTDDLIAHLLLMRGDEHCYWKQANQIPIERPNSGI